MLNKISIDFVDDLALRSMQNNRLRLNENLHIDFFDPCQRLINVLQTESYIQPHRHSLDPKEECLIAIRGRFALLIFDDSGNLVEIVEFSSEKYIRAGVSYGVTIPANLWHTVIALIPNSALFETKAGPFNPSCAKEIPVWAPLEGSPNARAYFLHLKNLATNLLDP